MSTFVPTRERERQSWTSEYWLDHCEGFRVETSKSRLGFVEEVIWDPENGELTALLVRKSHDGFDLIAVPIAQVREVHPEIEELDVATQSPAGVERP